MGRLGPGALVAARRLWAPTVLPAAHGLLSQHPASLGVTDQSLAAKEGSGQLPLPRPGRGPSHGSLTSFVNPC